MEVYSGQMSLPTLKAKPHSPSPLMQKHGAFPVRPSSPRRNGRKALGMAGSPLSAMPSFLPWQKEIPLSAPVHRLSHPGLIRVLPWGDGRLGLQARFAFSGGPTRIKKCRFSGSSPKIGIGKEGRGRPRQSFNSPDFGKKSRRKKPKSALLQGMLNGYLILRPGTSGSTSRSSRLCTMSRVPCLYFWKCADLMWLS